MGSSKPHRLSCMNTEGKLEIKLFFMSVLSRSESEDFVVHGLLLTLSLSVCLPPLLFFFLPSNLPPVRVHAIPLVLIPGRWRRGRKLGVNTKRLPRVHQNQERWRWQRSAHLVGNGSLISDTDIASGLEST